MATRSAKEYLGSGEAENLVVSGNVGYLAVQDSAYNGMFLRVENGITGLYKAPDQDTHWEDVDNTQKVLDTVDTEILSITTDEELTADNGSYIVSCRLDNTSNQTRDVTIHAEINGTSGSSTIYGLEKNEIDKSVLISGVIDSTVASGAVINVWFDSSGAGVELRGDILETKLKVTAAKSAPVTMSIEEVSSFDWNQLPSGNTHVDGQLYLTGNGAVKVSQG